MLRWAELAHPPLGTAGDESETLCARLCTKGASGVAGTEFFQLTLSGTASTSTASVGNRYRTSGTWQKTVLGQRESSHLYDLIGSMPC